MTVGAITGVGVALNVGDGSTSALARLLTSLRDTFSVGLSALHAAISTTRIIQNNLEVLKLFIGPISSLLMSRWVSKR
jgi:hypothetical protein